MLETPLIKVVKLDYSDMISSPSMIQDFYNEFMEKTVEACMEVENKIIKEFAEEEGLSLKCAEFFIRKHFRFRLEVIHPNSMIGTPKLQMIFEPKPVEELLNNDDVDTLLAKECERELIEKGD